MYPSKEILDMLQNIKFGKPTKKQRQEAKKTVMVKPKNTVGRNDLCPCESNKKYKNCCLDK